MDTTAIIVALISVIGGGTLIPLLYGRWLKRQPAERKAGVAREEERTNKAAKEAVEAVRGVLSEMRTQREEDRQELARLRGRVAELEADNRHLQGRLDVLERA